MKSISVRAAPPRLASASFAAGNLYRHRHEVFGAIELEVVHLHGDRDVGDRVLEHQRLFELALLVRGRELRELLVGEIALAVRRGRPTGRRVSVTLTRWNLPSFAVWVLVEADDVVAGDRARRLHDAERQIVAVEQRLAAGVFRQAVERVLRTLEAGHARVRGLAGKHAECPPGDGRVASPSGALATSPRASTG